MRWPLLHVLLYVPRYSTGCFNNNQTTSKHCMTKGHWTFFIIWLLFNVLISFFGDADSGEFFADRREYKYSRRQHSAPFVPTQV